MRQTRDPRQIQRYIDSFGLQNYFSLNLTDISTLTFYDKDEPLSSEGELHNQLEFLLEGECIAYTVTGANKIHCELHYRGFNVMGLVGALWNQPAINNIRSITPCTMLAIPLDTYRDTLLSDVKFLRFALENLSSHIRKNASHFERPEVRLASFILQMEKDNVFDYNLTICADLLEVSYRHLLRTLLSLCDQGILQKRSKGIYIIQDRLMLQRLAGVHI